MLTIAFGDANLNAEDNLSPARFAHHFARPEHPRRKAQT